MNIMNMKTGFLIMSVFFFKHAAPSNKRHIKWCLTLQKKGQSRNRPLPLQVTGVGAPERRRSSSWSGQSRPEILPFVSTRWIHWSGRLSRPDAAWPPRTSCWCECWPRRTWTPSPYPGQSGNNGPGFELNLRQTRTKLLSVAICLNQTPIETQFPVSHTFTGINWFKHSVNANVVGINVLMYMWVLL